MHLIIGSMFNFCYACRLTFDKSPLIPIHLFVPDLTMFSTGLLTIIYRLSASIGDNRIAIIKLSIIVIAIKTYSALSLSRYDNFAGYRIIER